MRLPALVFLAVTAGAALPCSATIAVLEYDGQSLVVAADSRALDEQQRPSDDACKIANIANRAVFVSSGALGFRRQMDDAVRRSDDTRTIAETFAQAVSDHFAQLGRIRPDEVERLTTVNGGGLLTSIVIGADLRAFEIRVEGVPEKVTWSVTPIENCSAHGICAIGQVDTVTAQRRKHSPKELVERTAREHPEEVGGPIDVLEWRRGGDPKWSTRKPTCPAQ